jgi:hypothetical protein
MDLGLGTFFFLLGKNAFSHFTQLEQLPCLTPLAASSGGGRRPHTSVLLNIVLLVCIPWNYY